MCAHSPCLPTPDEARALIRKGYANRLAIYKASPIDDSASFIAPAIVGRADEILPRTDLGPCNFFKDGKCELHDLGLKPFEGRIAHHDRHWMQVRMAAVATWKGKSFASVQAQLIRVKAEAEANVAA